MSGRDRLAVASCSGMAAAKPGLNPLQLKALALTKEKPIWQQDMTNSVSWAPFLFTPPTEVPLRNYSRSVMGMPWDQGIAPPRANNAQAENDARAARAKPRQSQAPPAHFELCGSEYSRAYRWNRPQSAPAQTSQRHTLTPSPSTATYEFAVLVRGRTTQAPLQPPPYMFYGTKRAGLPHPSPLPNSPYMERAATMRHHVFTRPKTALPR